MQETNSFILALWSLLIIRDITNWSINFPLKMNLGLENVMPTIKECADNLAMHGV